MPLQARIAQKVQRGFQETSSNTGTVVAQNVSMRMESRKSGSQMRPQYPLRQEPYRKFEDTARDTRAGSSSSDP
jgi:hypothetical protein